MPHRVGTTSPVFNSRRVPGDQRGVRGGPRTLWKIPNTALDPAGGRYAQDPKKNMRPAGAYDMPQHFRRARYQELSHISPGIDSLSALPKVDAAARGLRGIDKVPLVPVAVGLGGL